MRPIKFLKTFAGMPTTFVGLFCAVSILVCNTGCKKDELSSAPLVADLNIVNAIPGSANLIANINNQLPYYKGQVSFGYKSYKLYRFAGGSTSLSLVQTIDTTHNLLSTSLNLPPNTIHSLFLTGSTNNPDTVFVEDAPPAHNLIHGASDSTTGIRFINLSSGSNPISINIQGQSNGSEVNSLAYRSITAFKNYSAVSTISSYTFEFRDALSGTFLTSYTLNGVNDVFNSVLFKNFTIVLSGLPGSQSTFIVSNDY